jgi:hypothetical protein
MSVRLHRQAEQLMAEADLLRIAGKPDEARSRWLEAARVEAQVFSLIPEERRKTRGIIAVSTVVFFRRAGALDEAVRSACEYLSNGNLLPAWQIELQTLLDDIRAEKQATTSGRAHKADPLDVSLHDISAGE